MNITTDGFTIYVSLSSHALDKGFYTSVMKMDEQNPAQTFSNSQLVKLRVILFISVNPPNLIHSHFRVSRLEIQTDCKKDVVLNFSPKM